MNKKQSLFIALTVFSAICNQTHADQLSLGNHTGQPVDIKVLRNYTSEEYDPEYTLLATDADKELPEYRNNPYVFGQKLDITVPDGKSFSRILIKPHGMDKRFYNYPCDNFPPGKRSGTNRFYADITMITNDEIEHCEQRSFTLRNMGRVKL